MGIRIIWDDAAKTIIRHVFEGNWTIEDYYNLISEHQKQLAELKHPVAVINDLRQSGPIPAGIGSAIKYAARKAPAIEEIKFVVGSDRSVKTLIDLINVTAGSDVTDLIYVSTIEEAYALIAEHRAKTRQDDAEPGGSLLQKAVDPHHETDGP
ncbi:MAG: hypothetical protein DWB42_10870 [Chloroflexi bacterium]|nr:hypothetical protein [Chloroflexota bacterium]MDL1884540.1 hypothetical protein [Anaerolineae bacterium CFX8]GIL13241.1 MAG: hypothetical protein BroJett038_19610 [Chloroflexota bacterium]